MECTRTQDMLSSYLDGDLSDREQGEIAGHIRQCSRCAEEERALRETLSLLRNLPAEAAPPELLKGVKQRIAEKTAVPLWKKVFLPAHIKIPLEAAAVVLVFLLVYGIQKEMPATTPVPSPPASAESGVRVARTGPVAERPVADTIRGAKAEPSPEKERKSVVTPIPENPTVHARTEPPADLAEPVRTGIGATGKEREAVPEPMPERPGTFAKSELPAGLAARVSTESGAIGKEREIVSEPMPERPGTFARSELPAGLARVSTESGTTEPVFLRQSPPGETEEIHFFAAPPGLLRQEVSGREVTIEVDRDARPGVEDRIAAVALRLGGAVRRDRVRFATSRMEKAVVVSNVVRVRIPAVFADVFLEELGKLGSISPEGIPGKLDIPPGPSPDPVAYTVRIRVK
ncbi:MAG: zf-HC2 domain-containing protein [Candidatus Deferrimicrobiaceae bacterium]